MVISSIKETLDCDILKVWEIIFDVSQHSKWRSDLAKQNLLMINNLLNILKMIMRQYLQ